MFHYVMMLLFSMAGKKSRHQDVDQGCDEKELLLPTRNNLSRGNKQVPETETENETTSK